MNRMFVIGIAAFVAVVGIALVGGEKVAVAGHGCHGCSGCSGDCGVLLVRWCPGLLWLPRRSVGSPACP